MLRQPLVLPILLITILLSGCSTFDEIVPGRKTESPTG